MKKLSSLIQQISDTPPREWQYLLRARLPRTQKKDAISFCKQSPCLFVLSTGRVGTQTLAALLQLTSGFVVYHEPYPRLYGLSQLAYRYSEEELVRQTLLEAFLSARESLFNKAQVWGRGYAETAPHITFLAPVIAEAFPSVRFIHLVRDPRMVIRSGLRRGWYEGHPFDRTRIQPRPGDPHADFWPHYSAFEKNTWLWAETNQWILSFLSTFPQEQQLRLYSEDMFSANERTLASLYEFAESPVPSKRKIKRVLGKKLNAQRTGSFPEPGEWNEEMESRVRALAGDVARQLGYEL